MKEETANDVRRIMEQIRETQWALPADVQCTWEDALETSQQALVSSRTHEAFRRELLLRSAAWALYAHELLTRA